MYMSLCVSIWRMLHKIVFDSEQLDAFDSIVMVYSKEAHHKGESTKFILKWKGPFMIVKMIGPVTFWLVHLFTGNETTAHVNVCARSRCISHHQQQISLPCQQLLITRI